MNEFVVHHAYVQPGEPLPCDRRAILHIAGRSQGTALDVWWYGYDEEEDDGD